MSGRLEAIKLDWVEKQKTYQFRPLTLEVNDVNWLIEQAERAEKAEKLISKLHKGLGMSVTIDRQLWVETDRYMKALAGESK